MGFREVFSNALRNGRFQAFDVESTQIEEIIKEMLFSALYLNTNPTSRTGFHSPNSGKMFNFPLLPVSRVRVLSWNSSQQRRYSWLWVRYSGSGGREY